MINVHRMGHLLIVCSVIFMAKCAPTRNMELRYEPPKAKIIEKPKVQVKKVLKLDNILFWVKRHPITTSILVIFGAYLIRAIIKDFIFYR
jgi:hypothetical protein